MLLLLWAASLADLEVLVRLYDRMFHLLRERFTFFLDLFLLFLAQFLLERSDAATDAFLFGLFYLLWLLRLEAVRFRVDLRSRLVDYHDMSCLVLRPAVIRPLRDDFLKQLSQLFGPSHPIIHTL